MRKSLTVALVLTGALLAGCSQAEKEPAPATCEQVRAAGKGPYVKGKDPEYSRYEDRDHDGVVCEEA